MATAPRTFPAAPFIAPATGSIDQRLAQVAQAINRKADATTTPVFSAVLFQADDGSTWRFSVDATGAPVIEQVSV